MNMDWSIYLVVKKIKSENSALKERLEQAVHLSDMYREQCINAEEEVARVRDEIAHNQTIFQDRTCKLVDKLELTTKVGYYIIFTWSILI